MVVIGPPGALWSADSGVTGRIRSIGLLRARARLQHDITTSWRQHISIPSPNPASHNPQSTHARVAISASRHQSSRCLRSAPHHRSHETIQSRQSQPANRDRPSVLTALPTEVRLEIYRFAFPTGRAKLINPTILTGLYSLSMDADGLRRFMQAVLRRSHHTHTLREHNPCPRRV